MKLSSQSKGTWDVERNAEVSEVSQQTPLWMPEETNPTWPCGILFCPILASLEPEHPEPESPNGRPMLLNSPMHDSYLSAYLAQSDFGLKTS